MAPTGLSTRKLPKLGGGLRGFLADEAFADAGSLAGTFAQVVKLGAAHVTVALHFDTGDHRGVSLERTFHAFTGRDLANAHSWNPS